MKLIALLSCLVAVQANVIVGTCDGVTISGVYYDREVLHQDLGRPYLLAVDYNTNSLFFSHTKNTAESDTTYESAKINLNVNDFKAIEGVHNPFAQAVDQESHEVYIGGSDGVYKYDYSTNKATMIGAKDVNIWTLFYKDVLYYTTYPSQFLFTLINGVSTRFVELEDVKVDNFVIDNEDVMYYNNDTGLFSQKKGTKEAFTINFDETSVRAMTINRNGDIYLCVPDGIYKINKDESTVVKVLEVDGAYGVSFDADNNMVYADDSKLYRLKPNPKKVC